MTDHDPSPLPVDDWFGRLTELLPGPSVGIGAEERDLLLDLARVAAHTSQRWTAPVSTYLAGLALADASDAQRAQVLRELVAHLEAASGSDA